MKLNEIIRSLRKGQNLTQEQLAGYLGVTAPAVNKWENGISYPDITLIPVLARVLNTDVNTLFSFDVELTQEEINAYALQLNSILKEKDYETAFLTGEKLINTYPSCDNLILTIANLLFGYLKLLQVMDSEEYLEKIHRWYVLVSGSKDSKLAESAKIFLFSYHMHKKEYETAQALLDSIPEVTNDKSRLQAQLYLDQGNEEEGIKILESILYRNINAVTSSLISLLEIECQQENYELAQKTADLNSECAKLFGLGAFADVMPQLILAAVRKDEAKTIELVKQVLSIEETEYFSVNSYLFQHLDLKKPTNMNSKALLMGLIQSDKTFEFLRENKEFLALVES